MTSPVFPLWSSNTLVNQLPQYYFVLLRLWALPSPIFKSWVVRMKLHKYYILKKTWSTNCYNCFYNIKCEYTGFNNLSFSVDSGNQLTKIMNNIRTVKTVSRTTIWLQFILPVKLIQSIGWHGIPLSCCHYRQIVTSRNRSVAVAKNKTSDSKLNYRNISWQLSPCFIDVWSNVLFVLYNLFIWYFIREIWNIAPNKLRFSPL